jgi:integrase
MASLMYGCGLRLLECVELSRQGGNFDRGELTVRDGKGRKDRMTMLTAALRTALREHLPRVKAQHDADVAAGRGSVALPGALGLKYPNACREWGWQAGSGSFRRRACTSTARRANGGATI